MDPNQPGQTPVPESPLSPTPPPSTPTLPGPAPTPLVPVPAVPQAYTGMKPSRKPLLFTVIAVLVLLAVSGGAIAYVRSHPQAAPQPTPTPAVATDDIKQALPDLDTSLKEVDVNISTITLGLDDIQGDLSE